MHNKKQNLLILGIFILFLAISLPITVYFALQPQEQRTQAVASTSLYLSPATASSSPLTKAVGEQVSFDVMIDPGNNLPSIVKLEIQFDPTKLQAHGANTFTANTTAFPQVVEGPVVVNGSVFVTLSIGSDSTKAIQQTTKAGTVTFTALSATTQPTIIAIGNKTQVLSVASADNVTENVLSSTLPGYVTITGSAITPTVVATITATPSATPTPTVQPTPSPTPTITGTRLSLTVFMHGIGNSGDNANPISFSLSNKSPNHPARDVTVLLYDKTNTLTASASGLVIYNNSNGNFTGVIPLPETAVAGQYLIKVKEPLHLRRLISGIQTLIVDDNNTMPAITLVTGDTNNDNILNIVDYNMLIGCYSDLQPAVSCTSTQKLQSDLNDNGSVNQTDYNLFLREITVQNGD